MTGVQTCALPIFTAGGDLIFPRGLPVGVVDKVLRDPDRDSFIDVIVKPAAHLDRLDEVLVIADTAPRFSNEQQQDLATSEEMKGAEAAAINEQKKASAIMAERLPGLTDPNAPTPSPAAGPAANTKSPQPGQNPPAIPQPEKPKLLPPQHPDRFTPSATPEVPGDANPNANTKTKTGEKP